MSKNTYLTVIFVTLFVLTSCTDDAQPKTKTDKKKTYKPIPLNDVPAAPRSQMPVEVKEADVEKYQKEEAQMSDFEKHAQSVSRRHRR